MHREKWLETFPRGSWVLTHTLNFKLEFTFGQEAQENTKGSQVGSDMAKTKVEREYLAMLWKIIRFRAFVLVQGFPKEPWNTCPERYIS